MSYLSHPKIEIEDPEEKQVLSSENEKSFEIYPNPFIDKLKFLRFQGEALINIYDLQGNLIFRGK